MNIEELLRTGNVTLAISASDLKEFGLALIAEAAAIQQGQNKVEETMLTADEVCKALSISGNSLWRWRRSGVLQGVKLGRKVLYRKSDVDLLFKGRA